MQKNREGNLETFLANAPHQLYRKIKPLKEHWEKKQVFRMA